MDGKKRRREQVIWFAISINSVWLVVNLWRFFFNGFTYDTPQALIGTMVGVILLGILTFDKLTEKTKASQMGFNVQRVQRVKK